MITFEATIGSLVEDAVYTWIFQAEDEEKAYDMAYEHWKDVNYVDHGTMDIKILYEAELKDVRKEDNRDKLWLVEYIARKEEYRISRFAEPDQTVAYEDSWQDAVRDIKGNYGIDGLIIFIRESEGYVHYWCEADYV